MKNMYSKIMLSLILGASVVSANNAEAFKLSVFHVNDIHSHISSERMKLKVDGVKTYMQIGGYARMVNQLKKLKAKKPNSLILNAGDTFQGTLFYSLFKGKADAKALNLISWDAYALGNHEFDDGDKALADFLDLLDDDITMLAANVVPDKGNILEGKWSPYVIKTVGKEKIGIIGIDIVGKTIKSSNPSDEIKFSDETKTAQKYINELKALGINKIIVLSHQGYKNDLKMAAALSGVDI